MYGTSLTRMLGNHCSMMFAIARWALWRRHCYYVFNDENEVEAAEASLGAMAIEPQLGVIQDALGVTQIIRDESLALVDSVLVLRVKELLDRDWLGRVMHVGHEGTSVADAARMSRESALDEITFMYPPTGVVALYNVDRGVV
ncbi:hypothetical protein V6N12_058883 [Hibiscus sabdariffa]|uniref:Uncharacterized protein n=1 Tax=Hibiscus sabdariffa TaxID=183260 RepID=A0ABR2ETF9_9ROSI